VPVGTDAVELDRLREEFLDALVWGDARLAELIAIEAVTRGVDLATLYVEVLTPALHEIGERWQRGSMSIADEHLATALVENVMGIVRNAGTRAPRRTRERILLAAVEAEGHIVGLRMLSDLAEGAGFDVRYLGAAVPSHTLEGIVRRHDPRVVALTLTIGGPARALTEAIDTVAGTFPDVAILVGGSGIPEAVREDPRVHYAPDTREALRLIEQLVERAPAA
jgi:MerR family transcriptional regulator, light-induced transcriptional regulator